MAAAAPAALAAAKIGAQETAGVIRSLLNALEKPLYSDAKTTTTTSVKKNGDVVVRTHTKGFTVSTGLFLGGLGLVALWEIAMGWLGNGGGSSDGEEGGAQTTQNLGILTLNPGLWAVGEVESLFAHSPQTLSIPPTAMSALNQTLLHLQLPLLATAQQMGGTSAATVQEAFQKFVAGLQKP